METSLIKEINKIKKIMDTQLNESYSDKGNSVPYNITTQDGKIIVNNKSYQVKTQKKTMVGNVDVILNIKKIEPDKKEIGGYLFDYDAIISGIKVSSGNKSKINSQKANELMSKLSMGITPVNIDTPEGKKLTFTLS
jgi:hypothetical protein